MVPPPGFEPGSRARKARILGRAILRRRGKDWWARGDLNPRPPGYEPGDTAGLVDPVSAGLSYGPARISMYCLVVVGGFLGLSLIISKTASTLLALLLACLSLCSSSLALAMQPARRCLEVHRIPLVLAPFLSP